MQFRLSTLFLVFVFVASAVGAFETAGLLIALCVLALLLGIRAARLARVIAGCLVLLLLLVFLALLLPVSCVVCESARRAQCANNLKQIALALHAYHDRYGCLPPAVVRDPQGRPMHSWRVLLLPFIEYNGLYKQYDFGEPWDGPKSRLLASKMPPTYACPSVPWGPGPRTITQYLVVTGPGTLWPIDGTCGRFSDGKDERSKTLLVVECSQSDVCWMEPRDLLLPQPGAQESLPCPVPCGHAFEKGYFIIEAVSGAHVALADGSVHRLSGPLAGFGLWECAQHSDGHPVGKLLFDFEEAFYDCIDRRMAKRYVHWGHVTGVALFALTFVMLFWKAAFAPIGQKPADARSGCSGA